MSIRETKDHREQKRVFLLLPGDQKQLPASPRRMRTQQYGARKEAEDHAIATENHCSLSLSLSLSLSRVAPTKAIAQNCRVRSRSARDRHKTWQAENPDFLLCRTRRTSACHCACPRTAALRLALCGSLSRVPPFTFVEEFDENFLGT